MIQNQQNKQQCQSKGQNQLLNTSQLKPKPHISSPNKSTQQNQCQRYIRTFSLQDLFIIIIVIMFVIVVGLQIIQRYRSIIRYDNLQINRINDQKFKDVQSNKTSLIILQKAQQKQLSKIKDYRFIQVKIVKQIIKTLPYDISSLLIQIPTSQIIYIPYQQGQYAKMPLNPFHLKKYNRTFNQEFYSSQDLRRQRVQFVNNRSKFLQKFTKLKSIHLVKYNNPINQTMYNQGLQKSKDKWLRLDQKFNISSIKTQLPFCIITPGFNNNSTFRIQQNLNSIFMQNYTNYKVLIIDDASTDGSTQQYIKYFKIHKIDKKYYTLLSNKVKATVLPNIYFGVLYYCSKDSISMIVDGDDELIGHNTLQLFNWWYQTKKSGVLYSNFIRMYHKQSHYKFQKVENQKYTQKQKFRNSYRQQFMMKFHPLNSFRTQLLFHMHPRNLLDKNKQFFKTSHDWALFLPLMQLSCGNVDHIPQQYSYLANRGTGFNDYNINYQQQQQNSNFIRKIKKQQCCNNCSIKYK